MKFLKRDEAIGLHAKSSAQSVFIRVYLRLIPNPKSFIISPRFCARRAQRKISCIFSIAINAALVAGYGLVEVIGCALLSAAGIANRDRVSERQHIS